MKRSTTKTRLAAVNVSMPAPLRDRLTKKVEKLGVHSSLSDYVRDLIRRDLNRDAQLAQLDELISDGLKSPGERVTEQWWKDRHAKLEQHRRDRARKQRKRA